MRAVRKVEDGDLKSVIFVILMAVFVIIVEIRVRGFPLQSAKFGSLYIFFKSNNL